MRLVKDDQDMAPEDQAIATEQAEFALHDGSLPEPVNRMGDEQEASNPDPAAQPSTEDVPDGAIEAADEGPADATPVDLGLLEALLFGTQHPLTAARLVELMGLKSAKSIRTGVKSLNESYESSQRAFRIEQVAGGYQMLTLPIYGEPLKKLHHREIDAKLTKSALETLAIIAYKQPILRADIEAIRGVACGETIRSLMEKHLVKIAGRAEEPGRPILYGTTKRFLELFGLNSLRDLPQSEDPLNAKN
jgi:segregation and condensation protein B